jgi:hypothetical protein
MHLTIACALALTHLSLTRAWNTFTVPHADGKDDTPALAAALATGNYSSNATILFQKGVKYNMFTPIVFPKLENVEVRVEGNISYPTDVASVQGTTFGIYRVGYLLIIMFA